MLLKHMFAACALLVCHLANCAAHAQWEHWVRASDVVSSLASDGQRLFADLPDGVSFSLDEGESWRPGEPAVSARQIVIGQGAVYALSWDQGVYRSDTRGNTWHPKNDGLIIEQYDGSLHLPPIRQLLVTSSGMLITVGAKSHISHNRGDIWGDVSLKWKIPKTPDTPEINIGDDIVSIYEFDGYLWAAHGESAEGEFKAFRSPDEGETWEMLPNSDVDDIVQFGRINDWATLDDKLYVAGQYGFGRWNEAELKWDNLSQGLPHKAYVSGLVVHSNRIFAAIDVFPWGVWIFHERSEMWRPAGMQRTLVYTLVSHQSDLYVGTAYGIYRASIPVIQPYGKALTTWGGIKTGNFR